MMKGLTKSLDMKLSLVSLEILNSNAIFYHVSGHEDGFVADHGGDDGNGNVKDVGS